MSPSSSQPAQPEEPARPIETFSLRELGDKHPEAFAYLFPQEHGGIDAADCFVDVRHWYLAHTSRDRGGSSEYRLRCTGADGCADFDGSNRITLSQAEPIFDAAPASLADSYSVTENTEDDLPATIGPTDLREAAEQAIDTGESIEVYTISLEGHAERAVALYLPTEGRIGIAWGADATWADAPSAEMGIEMWVLRPDEYEAKN